MRDKSNIMPSSSERSPCLKIGSPEERSSFLHVLGLFRLFDLYFFGLQENIDGSVRELKGV